MKRTFGIAFLAAALAAISGCKPQGEPVSIRVVDGADEAVSVGGDAASSAMPDPEVAVIKTVHGEMTAEFWPDVAPHTVANFKKLAKQGFYDGTCFHRVIEGFMIQGGDPKTKNPALQQEWGTGDPGYKIKAEFNNRKHVRGVLSMARSADPDSAGSQFFICHGVASSLDGKYTTFGKVIAGDDVLEKIATTPTSYPPHGGGEKSWPVDRMGVESIAIVKRETAGTGQAEASNPPADAK